MKESLSLLGLPMWVGLLYLLLGFASVKAEWHGELSFRSDYVYRGYSKSQGDPVVQGLIDYQSKSGFFGGLGLSQVNFNDNANANRAQLEIKPYLGGMLQRRPVIFIKNNAVIMIMITERSIFVENRSFYD